MWFSIKGYVILVNTSSETCTQPTRYRLVSDSPTTLVRVAAGFLMFSGAYLLLIVTVTLFAFAFGFAGFGGGQLYWRAVLVGIAAGGGMIWTGVLIGGPRRHGGVLR